MYPGEILKYLAKIEELVDSIPDGEIPDGVILDVRVKWYGDHLAKLYEEGWNFDQPEKETR